MKEGSKCVKPEENKEFTEITKQNEETILKHKKK